jgi:hypothetical protein
MQVNGPEQHMLEKNRKFANKWASNEMGTNAMLNAMLHEMYIINAVLNAMYIINAMLLTEKNSEHIFRQKIVP